MNETEFEAMVDRWVERPTWDEFWCVVNGEDWLTAKRLIELDDVVLEDACRWLRYDDRGRERSANLDLRGWVADVDETGRDWSSTQRNLFELVAAVLDRDRTISLHKVLGYTGSWERELWSILVTWGTGGDNRDHQGRAGVVPNN